VAQGERPSAEVVVTLSIDSIPPSSFRAVASAVVTVTVRIVCERVEKSPREMTMTVLQRWRRCEKRVLLNTRKISRLLEAVAVLGSRVIGHAATARNDGERKTVFFRNTVLVMATLSRPSSFRAVASAVVIVTARIVCARESRNLPEK
jgi:hypothetical protein